ncbi:MAG: hypothetical protein WDZ94_04095 [Patescibacteria group bacterium]
MTEVFQGMTETETSFVMLLRYYLRIGHYTSDDEYYFMPIEANDFVLTMWHNAKSDLLRERYRVLKREDSNDWIIIWPKVRQAFAPSNFFYEQQEILF